MDTVLNKLTPKDLRVAIRDFARWWVGELGYLLPPRWRELGRLRRDHLVMWLAGSELSVDLCSDHRQRHLGRYQLAQGIGDQQQLSKAAVADLPALNVETVLQLSADAVLCRDLDLPPEAEENLRDVLAFEMDRQTPFSAERVYFDAEIVARPPDTPQLQVKLWVVPRQILDEALDRLSAFGIHPAIVNAFGNDAGEAGSCDDSAVNLLPQERRAHSTRPARRLNLALTALALLLLVAAVVLPLVQQHTLVTNLQSLVANAAQQAKAMEQLHGELEKFSEQSRFVTQQLQNSPRIVPLLAEITRLIPDDTWLSSLSLSGDKLEIQGESPSASSLIALVEASRSFQHANFLSPVVQDQRTGNERFQLSADIVIAPPSP